MTAIIFGIGLMCILVALVILMFKPYDYGATVAQFKRIGKTSNGPKEDGDTQWRSVRIRPGLISCRHVGDLEGQTFLSREAPELPLAGCGERGCRCHYIFLDDRRSGIDRRVELGRLGEFLSSSERDRRQTPGRRMGDLVAV